MTKIENPMQILVGHQTLWLYQFCLKREKSWLIYFCLSMCRDISRNNDEMYFILYQIAVTLAYNVYACFVGSTKLHQHRPYYLVVRHYNVCGKRFCSPKLKKFYLLTRFMCINTGSIAVFHHVFQQHQINILRKNSSAV